jgi:hypothetical protein
VNATPALIEIDDPFITSPSPQVAHPLVEASAEDLTSVAGVSLWGELLDRLGLVAEADRHNLRPIGPGGYRGGECYRAVVETQLAGGDFISDPHALVDEAGDLCPRARAPAPGADGEHVAGLAADPDERGHLHLALVGEARSLLLLAVRVENAAARVTRSGRRLHLRLARGYAHADAFIAALSALRQLPAFA